MKQIKKGIELPEFENEEAEHKYWEAIDLADYYEAKDLQSFDLEQFLKDHREPQTTRITIRVPTKLVKIYKARAAKLDVPYQSLMKQELYKGSQSK